MKVGSFLLLVPFFLIRFGLLSLLNKEAVKHAAFFPPVLGKEVPAYWIYQFSNLAIFIYLLLLSVKTEPFGVFCAGLAVYGFGLAMCIFSVVHFAAPSQNGMKRNGLYRISRNPMYISYFIFFIGCALLTQSWILLVFVLLFQITAHWIILSEERWCVEQFGAEYIQYMKEVRRYI